MSEKDRKVVVFIDSMGNDDLEHMPFVREEMQTGEMDAGPVFVTPVVMGSIYTGTEPTQHGLPAVSKYDQPARLRPNGPTLPEMAALDDQYENVLQFGLPFIVPSQARPEGNYWHVSEAMGQQSFQPAEAQNVLQLPAPAGAMDKPGENLDLAFNLRVDHAMMTFGTARNLIEQWDTDVAFVSYRVADSYAHYHYSEPEEGNTYRDDLLSQIDDEIRFLANQAEVFVFGDHGARDLTEVFRINRWLKDHGYLEFDIDVEWREKAKEYGFIEVDEDVPGEVLTADSPGVSVDEEVSVAIGDDPFSTGLTLLPGATPDQVESMVEELQAEDAITSVEWTRDLFGHGDLIEECPDMYALRAPGVFVSGNLHPELGGPEVTRTGVHHPIGAFGSTGSVEIPAERITPVQLHRVIADFLDLDRSEDYDLDGDLEAETADSAAVRENLEDLGYI